MPMSSPTSTVGSSKIASAMQNAHPPLPWGTHWKLAMRQLRAGAGSLVLGFGFLMPLLYLTLIRQDIDWLSIGLAVLCGLCMGIQPLKVVWNKAQLRALGFGTSDIRRNFSILMPITALVGGGTLALGCLLLALAAQPGPIFAYFLATYVAVNLACIIGGIARAGENSDVINDKEKAQASPDSSVNEGADRDTTKRAGGGALGFVAGVFSADSRWRRQEKAGNAPSALAYLVTWRIERTMAWSALAVFVTTTSGVVGWFASGLTTGGAMWMYPAFLMVLIFACLMGETMGLSLNNWLVLSGERRDWYAQAIGAMIKGLSAIALALLLGVAEFFLLDALFPDVADFDPQLSGQLIVLAVLATGGIVAFFPVIAIISFWINNRLNGWKKWIAVILAWLMISGALGGILAGASNNVRTVQGLIGYAGIFLTAAVILLGIVLVGLRAKLARFDTANETMRDNLGIRAEA